MIKKMVIITCGSYSAVILLISLFTKLGWNHDFSETRTLQLFVISFSISFLMLIAEYLETKLHFSSLLFDTSIRVLICYFVVFLEGSLFGMFPFAFSSLLSISPILIPVFLITYTISYITCVEWAHSINESIKRKNK